MRSDYIVGALVLAIIFLSFFTLWMLIVTLFMCLGPARVGFLSGFAFKEPEGDSQSSEKSRDFKLPRRIRTVFVVSCIIVIAASVSAYTISLKGMSQNTIGAIENVEVRVDLVLEIIFLHHFLAHLILTGTSNNWS